MDMEDQSLALSIFLPIGAGVAIAGYFFLLDKLSSTKINLKHSFHRLMPYASQVPVEEALSQRNYSTIEGRLENMFMDLLFGEVDGEITNFGKRASFNARTRFFDEESLSEFFEHVKDRKVRMEVYPQGKTLEVIRAEYTDESGSIYAY